MDKNFNVQLDIKNSTRNGYAEVVQGDTSTVLKISIVDNYIPIDLTGLTLKAIINKADDNTVFQDSTNGLLITDAKNGLVELKLKANSISAVGNTRTEIVLLEGEDRVTSAIFNFYVRASLDTGNVPISTSEVVTVNEYLASVDGAEVIRKDNETNRKSSEDIRAISETDRVDKEADRVASESTRKINEATRITKEADRVASETDRKSNEEIRKTNETARIASETDRANRFTQLTIAQQQAAEVVNSRTSTTKAKTFPELTDRIEDIEKDIVKPSYSELLTQNSQIFSVGTGKNPSNVDVDVSNSVVAGNLNIDTIYGDTLKNELTYNKDTWAEWTKSSGVVGDSTGLEWTTNGSAGQFAHLPTSIKASTKYGILYNVVSNTITGDFGFNNDVFGFQLLSKTVGNNKVIKNSNASISTNRVYLYNQLATEAAGNKIKLKGIRVYELPTGSQIEADFNNLSADQLALKYLWHSGIASVGELQADGQYKIEVLSRGENNINTSLSNIVRNENAEIINGRLQSKDTSGGKSALAYFKEPVYLVSGQEYTIRIPQNSNYSSSSIIPAELDALNPTNHYAITDSRIIVLLNAKLKKFIPTSTGYYHLGIYLAYNTNKINYLENTNIELELGDKLSTISYTPYVEDKINILTTQPLRRVSPTVADYIKNSEVKRNIGKYVLQESDIISITNGTNVDNITITNSIFNTGKSWIFTVLDNVLFDKYPQTTHLGGNTWDDVLKINNFYTSNSSGNKIYLTVTKGTYASLSEAKTALAGKVVYYELATPTVEKLNLETSKPNEPTGFLPLQCYEKGSVIINSGIIPKLSYKVPLNLKATVMDNNASIKAIKDYVNNLDSFTTAYLLTLETRVTLLESK